MDLAVQRVFSSEGQRWLVFGGLARVQVVFGLGAVVTVVRQGLVGRRLFGFELILLIIVTLLLTLEVIEVSFLSSLKVTVITLFLTLEVIIVTFFLTLEVIVITFLLTLEVIIVTLLLTLEVIVFSFVVVPWLVVLEVGLFPVIWCLLVLVEV